MGGLQARYPALTRNAPAILMGLAALVSVVVLLVMQSGLTFFQDEWNMVIHRTGFNAPAFFDPNDVHPVPLVVAIYKLNLAIFGLTTVGPDRVVSVLLYALTGILLFVYVRRRVGGWLALFPAVVLLFLGPGWNVLLWPFEMTLVGSLAAGLGTLLALERDDRTGDVLACFLLVVAMGCSSLGVSFALAAGVDVLLKWRRRGLWRLWVPAVSLVLYVIWYATYGHKVPSAVSLTNLTTAPLYVAEGVSTSVASLLGLNTASPTAEVFAHGSWAPVLLVALVLLCALWLARGRPQVRPQILVVLTAGGSFWLLSALNFIPGREPTASRYQYLGAALLVLLLAEIFRGYRPGPRVVGAGAALTAVVLLANIVPLKDGLTTVEQQSEFARSELAAIEIAERTVEPDFSLNPQIAGTETLTPIDAASYLKAVAEHGSPAAGFDEITTLSEGARKEADTVLVNALPVELIEGEGDTRPGGAAEPPLGVLTAPGVKTVGNCLEIAAGAAAAGVPLTLHGSTAFHVDPGAAAKLGLWRFGVGPSLENPLAAGSNTLLSIPADRSQAPWQAILTGSQAISACSVGSAAGSAG
jgi:hypothetical protein